jgi:hypothetical protein
VTMQTFDSRRLRPVSSPAMPAGDRVHERRRAAALARHYHDAEGLSIWETSRRLGRAEATVKAYLYDPTKDLRISRSSGRLLVMHGPRTASSYPALSRRHAAFPSTRSVRNDQSSPQIDAPRELPRVAQSGNPYGRVSRHFLLVFGQLSKRDASSSP